MGGEEDQALPHIYLEHNTIQSLVNGLNLPKDGHQNVQEVLSGSLKFYVFCGTMPQEPPRWL